LNHDESPFAVNDYRHPEGVYHEFDHASHRGAPGWKASTSGTARGPC
jgi:hypothetical protein